MPIETVKRALQEQYPDAQYHLVQFLSEHLVDCTRVFQGDLTRMVVLAVLGQAMLGAHRAASESGLRRSMTASRIADVLGLDRETVRRKLKAMAELGWLRQNADRSWEIATDRDGNTKVRQDLAALDGRGLERVARLYAALRPICEEA
jgi:CRP-like cAMP-binding protein